MSDGHREREGPLHRGRGPEPGAGDVADGVGGGEADDEGAEEGHGQAAQAPDDGGRVGVDDQQGQDERLQLQRGATRMPATEASEAPMDQLRVESRVEPAAEEPDQAAVVHDATHRDAGPGPVEEQAQTDGDGHGGADGDDLLPGDLDAEEGEAAVAEELGHHAGRRRPDVAVDQPEEEQGQADRDGQRGGHVARVHPLDHPPLHHRPEERGQHEDGEDEGQAGVDVPARPRAASRRRP